MNSCQLLQYMKKILKSPKYLSKRKFVKKKKRTEKITTSSINLMP